MKIQDEQGQHFEAVKVFAEAIRYMKRLLLKRLRDSHTGTIIEEDIDWVLPIPAIWEDSAKEFMVVAAEKVSIGCFSLYIFFF